MYACISLNSRYFGFVLILYLSRMSFDQSELFCPIHLRLYFFRKHFIFLQLIWLHHPAILSMCLCVITTRACKNWGRFGSLKSAQKSAQKSIYSKKHSKKHSKKWIHSKKDSKKRIYSKKHSKKHSKKWIYSKKDSKKSNQSKKWTQESVSTQKSKLKKSSKNWVKP